MQGAAVELIHESDPSSNLPRLGLVVTRGDEPAFHYHILPVATEIPSFAIRTSYNQYYRLEVHLQEGGQDYNLWGYSKEQVIDDILDQYEHHLHFLYLIQPTNNRNENLSPAG